MMTVRHWNFKTDRSQAVPFKCVHMLAALASIFCLASCATPTQSNAATKGKPATVKAKAATTTSEPTGGEIRIGMSKAQVLRAWGEPSGKDVTGSGEVWVWGNQNMMRMIPYAGAFLNVNTGKVMFRNGRVVDFRNTNSGNAWSQSEGMFGSRFSTW